MITEAEFLLLPSLPWPAWSDCGSAVARLKDGSLVEGELTIADSRLDQAGEDADVFTIRDADGRAHRIGTENVVEIRCLKLARKRRRLMRRDLLLDLPLVSHVVLQPRLFEVDGVWCCLLGPSSSAGLRGYGSTSEMAGLAFDRDYRVRGLAHLSVADQGDAVRRIAAARSAGR